MMIRMKSRVCALALIGAMMTLGCDKENPTPTPTPPQPTADADAAAALPASLFLEKEPANAQDLAAAKKTAKVGEEIVLRGRVAGQRDPLAPNRAIVTLLDPAIKTCEKNPGDSCATPWDACCEPSDVLVANTATIQVVDDAGQPLKVGLRGVQGIEPLKELVITGKVKTQESNTLVIDATGIHVKG